MKSAITNSTLDSSVSNVFIPMGETQMASKKGGDDIWGAEEFQQWLLDWINDQAEDPDSLVAHILSNFVELPDIGDESLWDLVGDDMAAEGLTLPPLEELENCLLLGSNGGL